MKINVDSIALSRDNRALYFAPLTGTELYCVETAAVHAAMCATDEDEECIKRHNALVNSVHVVLQDKPITDGITTDEAGNVWFTALGHSSIGNSKPHPPLDTKLLVANSSVCYVSTLNNMSL
jgi:sugar lactone lactonase YvrE